MTKRDLLKLLRDAKADAQVILRSNLLIAELRAMLADNGQDKDDDFAVVLEGDKIVIYATYS